MSDITVQLEDHIATVTLDRPPVNAITRDTMAELRDAFRALSAEREVRVAILTATGNKAFMAGVDLKSVDQRAAPESLSARAVTDPGSTARDAMWAIVDCAVPVIGAINGPALGAGLAFAACCDILIASENARFGTTEINVGLLGASSHLSLLVGRHKARELFFTGEQISADELYRLGALRAVVPSSELATDGADAGRAARSQEPDRTPAGQGIYEPGRAPLVPRRLQDRAGVHGTSPGLRGRQGGTPGLHGEARPRLQVAMIPAQAAAAGPTA